LHEKPEQSNSSAEKVYHGSESSVLYIIALFLIYKKNIKLMFIANNI